MRSGLRMVVIVGCAVLAGCGSHPRDRMVGGAGVGAGTGAAIGLAFGGVGAIPGAVIGAGIGGATGALTTPGEVNLGEPAWQ